MYPLKSLFPITAAFVTAGFWFTQPSEPVQPETQQRRGEIVFQERFEVEPGGTLRVDVSDGDVEIETHSGGGVEVDVSVSSRDMEWARERFEDMEFRAELQGNTVHVTADEARSGRNRYRRDYGISLVVRVRVPARFDLDIRSSDGDILVGDVQGNVMLHSSDGDIEVGNIRGGEVSIETQDGDVVVDGVVAPDVVIQTSDGDIDVRALSGGVNARTSDGDIRINVTEAGDVRLSTSDGDITIYAPPTLAATVDFQGEDLYVARGFEILGRVGRRTVRGDMNGGGVRLEATTHDGSVTLRAGGR